MTHTRQRVGVKSMFVQRKGGTVIVGNRVNTCELLCMDIYIGIVFVY